MVIGIIVIINRGRIAAQFSHILWKPSNKYLITGNYVVDYQDSLRRFGAMLNGIIVANPSTNIPEVFYATLNNYGSGTHINHVSVSIFLQQTYCSYKRILTNSIIFYATLAICQSRRYFSFIDDFFRSDEYKRYLKTIQIGRTKERTRALGDNYAHSRKNSIVRSLE